MKVAPIQSKNFNFEEHKEKRREKLAEKQEKQREVYKERLEVTKGKHIDIRT